MEALTLILARELRGHDIPVNAIAPDPTARPCSSKDTGASCAELTSGLGDGRIEHPPGTCASAAGWPLAAAHAVCMRRSFPPPGSHQHQPQEQP
jgi:hypothetical protein